MKFSLSVMILVIGLSAHAQLRLSGGAKIVVNGGTSSTPVFFVLNNPTATPIITSGTTDGILLEDEYNRLQYNLSTATTAITVPFMSSLLEQFPLTLTPTSAGAGSGNIRFSSRRASLRSSGWDNTSYVPSDVTNMAAPAIGNNSNMTIDRFWIIDASSYTTKPAVTLDFTYIDAEWSTNGSNTIAEANLQAQRFNPTNSDWEGYSTYPPAGTINITTNTVTGVTASPSDFFRSWTLNDRSIPLPVELLSFYAECENEKPVLKWCTASETNNNYFTIEASNDGIQFVEVDRVNASNAPYQMNCYKSELDLARANYSYYKISQTDLNGKREELKIIQSVSCGKEGNYSLANNGTSSPELLFQVNEDGNYFWEIYNSLGQMEKSKALELKKGLIREGIDTQGVSEGVYFLRLKTGEKVLADFKMIVLD